jgi:hypothetical protein
MPDIMHLVSFKTAPDKVFAALTSPEGVRAWWTADADLDRDVGGAGEFRFYVQLPFAAFLKEPESWGEVPVFALVGEQLR